MELRHLRYFLAVAEQMSFAKAAEVVHISQPPLSRQIQELEEEIGTRLFIRKNNKIEMTAAGEYMKVEAARILENVEVVTRSCRSLGDGGGRPLRIGAAGLLMESLLPSFLRDLQANHPYIRTEVLILPTESQELAIRNGNLDFGFVRHWVNSDGLVFEELGKEHLVICCPAAMYSGRSLARLAKAISTLPFILLSSKASPGLGLFLTSVLAKLGLRSTPDHECNDAETVLRMVHDGVGWSVMTESYLEKNGISGITMVKIPETIVYGLLYADKDLTPEEAAFLSIVRTRYGKGDAVHSSHLR